MPLRFLPLLTTMALASWSTRALMVSPVSCMRGALGASVRGGRPLRRLAAAMATESLDTAAARPSAAGLSLDLRLVAEEPDLVTAHLKSRKAGEEMLAAVPTLGELNNKRKEFIRVGDDARNKRKTLSQQIGKLMKEGNTEEAEALKAQVEEANRIADGAEAELEAVDSQCKQLLDAMPNLLHDQTPDGKGEQENELVKEWGTDQRMIGEDFLWHDEIAERLNGWNPEGAAKLAGARFSVLSGAVARLERALVQFFLDTHTKNGYTEMAVPYIVGRSVLEGTGQLPKFEDDLFKLENHQANAEDAFLIPTAEVPLTNLYRGEILDQGRLPLSMTALTPCFRAEAGSYGKDVRGLMRQHQFHKVEMVKVTSPETSDEEHETMTRHAEELLEALELPYRRMRLCSGDIGFGARQCFDLEVWLPGQQAYREISSISNCCDFQARRMNLRFRGSPEPGKKGKGKVSFCHTLNGSGLAVGRALLAVLENHQQPDGRVKVPDVLRGYMGGAEYLE